MLHANPALLIAVEGVNYATDLRGVAVRPVRLAVAGHLIYSVHDYAFTDNASTADGLRADLGSRWGWVLTQGQSWTAPVWLGEFGTWHPGLPWRRLALEMLAGGPVRSFGSQVVGICGAPLRSQRRAR